MLFKRKQAKRSEHAPNHEGMDISEPVISIGHSIFEHGRWETLDGSEPLALTIRDTKTDLYISAWRARSDGASEAHVKYVIGTHNKIYDNFGVSSILTDAQAGIDETRDEKLYLIACVERAHDQGIIGLWVEGRRKEQEAREYCMKMYCP